MLSNAIDSYVCTDTIYVLSSGCLRASTFSSHLRLSYCMLWLSRRCCEFFGYFFFNFFFINETILFSRSATHFDAIFTGLSVYVFEEHTIRRLRTTLEQCDGKTWRFPARGTLCGKRGLGGSTDSSQGRNSVRNFGKYGKYGKCGCRAPTGPHGRSTTMRCDALRYRIFERNGKLTAIVFC